VYEEPQWLSPVVEVVWEGKTVATGRAIAAVTPSTVDVEVGDIIMFGSPALTPRSATYQTQAYLSFVQASGTQVALYDPFWGPGLGTWDDSTSELGQRAFWGHVELAQAQGPYPVKDGFDLVVLRPTVLMHSAVDMGAASNRVLTGSYSQPFVGLFLDWSAWGRTNIAWIAARPELPLRWGELYGVDLFGLAPAEHYQYSPGLGSLAHTDLASPLFWQRDADCSSTSAWKIIWGWYQTQGEPVRSAFLNDPAAVSAVDAISPGQLAWWLVDRGYATPTR
jgi:hypothetical protein